MRDSERRNWTSWATTYSLAPRPITPKRSKYGNVRTIVDGHKFHSKLEAREYQKLKLFQAAGEVKFFLRQAPFDLPGQIIYRVDFLVVWKDGSVEGRETKGYLTDVSRIKIKQVEDLYGLRIVIIKKND